MHGDFTQVYRHEGSRWFRRFVKDAKRISPHIKIKRIKHGFYRIYFRNGYIGECYKEMPPIGYDIDEIDNRFEDRKFWEKKEDRAELTRKIKNFVEGYKQSIDSLQTNVYMMRHSAEHNKQAEEACKTMVVK